ncbi:UvrD-helicase domain-containing protein [Tessaracoccus sp. SD287]|uniref:nuclease-related domain-containing DEAD/DEAH box helicase n=1 Tax=Tessaracoccus sp. SD287 TaxID=2782008 RepID=UPI001A96AF12|nr:UvrD-helicase domain-containing protein [Tessaracoccus sp. SD287]MBO1031394.1 UvrD-helicase domain-containing protein [Tessaracoccus sp. SD287]
MAAGESAGTEARRQVALAEAHERAAVDARAMAGRYGIAEVTEKRVARVLAPLSAMDYHLLGDRRWPGTRRAQVDLVVVGPGGLFIVDTKAWREVSIDNDRVYRGDADVTDDLFALVDLADKVQADMAEIGLAPGEVRPLVVLAGRSGVDVTVNGVRILGERDVLRAIASHGSRLTPGQVDTVLARALNLFSQLNAPAPVVASVPEPVVPAAPQEPLMSDEEISDALLQGVLAQPVEEWMSFLHPQQAKLVRRSFPGPSRVRGPAGTGKTVVGLHRAAHLARTTEGRILVTTFVKTLPVVLRELLHRLAPETVERVEFTGMHAFARRILQERGIGVEVDPKGSDDAFTQAWHQVGAPSPLADLGLGERYWDEEIQYVLKGRGVTRFEDYAEMARTGRRQRLSVNSRRIVWDLYQAYDENLRSRGIHDYADLILLAEQDLVREPMKGRYSAVIVDEAQDLSLAMIRLLHSLVGDETDGLTLIGDGQQSIYPGGYSLSEAGVSVAGRGVVLDVNYRNTAQIVSFAQRLVDGSEYADIEGVVSQGDRPSSVPRSGPEPVISRFSGWRQMNEAMLARIADVTKEVSTGLGDVAVLCLTRRSAQAAATVLQKAGVPVVELEKYTGKPVDAVKVGTIKRAKGLEFKQVLIPDIRQNQTSMQPPAAESAFERWELTRRELYVAMIRARDGLWVGIGG